jgi:hypothetical protein
MCLFCSVAWHTQPGLRFWRQKLGALQQGLVSAVPGCAGQAGVHQLLQPLQAYRLLLLLRCAALQQHQSCNVASSSLCCPCIRLTHMLLQVLLLCVSLAALSSIQGLLLLLLVVVLATAPCNLPGPCWRCCWLSSLGSTWRLLLLLLLWRPSDAWQ